MKFKDLKIGQEFYYKRMYTKLGEDIAEKAVKFSPELEVYVIRNLADLEVGQKFILWDMEFIKMPGDLICRVACVEIQKYSGEVFCL